MNKIKKISTKDKKIYIGATIAFLAICITMGSLCFQYYRRLKETVKIENGEYMEEISKQIGINVSKSINDNFSVLESMGIVLESSDVSTYEQLNQMLSAQQKIWKYQKILLIDEKGVAYNSNGENILLNNDEYLQDAVVARKTSLSTSQVIDGEESVVFAAPINGTIFEGKKICAIASVYNLSTFDKMISIKAYGGKSCSHIIRKDGTTIMRSGGEHALMTGYNMLTSLAEADVKSGRTMEQVRLDIAANKSGQTEIVMGDNHEYMTYTPIGRQGAEDWSMVAFVPVEIVNAKSHLMLNITLMISGLVTVLFALLISIIMFGFYRNKRRLENIAYVDSVTKGNTSEKFCELAKEILEASQNQQYTMLYINIEKFKVLNEQFGRDACDEVLRSIEKGISADLDAEECMGHLFADNFGILIKYENESIVMQRLDKWYTGFINHVEKSKDVWLPLIVDVGIYAIDNVSLPITLMVDRAKLSLTGEVRELNGKLHYAIYDEKLRRILFREKQLEDMMERALENNEYKVYLQPKIDVKSEKIGGAEALVRWISASEGMIYPDEFIPLFEKNGFIVKLDLAVFEQVCQTIRRWIDEGREPIKISVNCSRVHLKRQNFLHGYSDIADRYNIPHRFIEIELTENAVFEDVEHLSYIINTIHDLGFGCSMDDFGSGYSSLNLIKDIPVDTLKLDKIFFKINTTAQICRTESVVSSIISMAKALSMFTVAEGVEDRLHVDMLKKLGCDYIQGYYFAKPMPISEFEDFAFKKND